MSNKMKKWFNLEKMAHIFTFENIAHISTALAALFSLIGIYVLKNTTNEQISSQEKLLNDQIKSQKELLDYQIKNQNEFQKNLLDYQLNKDSIIKLKQSYNDSIQNKLNHKFQTNLQKQSLNLQAQLNNNQIIEGKINSCIERRTKDRTISFNGKTQVGSDTIILKKLNGITENEAQFVCNCFYDNLEGIKTFFEFRFQPSKIDEEGKRSIFYSSNLKNYINILDFIKSKTSLGIFKFDINYFSKETGYTPLHQAIVDKNYEAISYLIKNGANIEARTRDESNYTPIQLALYLNDEKAIIILKKFGANLNANSFPILKEWDLLNMLDNYNSFNLYVKYNFQNNYVIDLYERILYLNSNNNNNDDYLLNIVKELEKSKNINTKNINYDLVLRLFYNSKIKTAIYLFNKYKLVFKIKYEKTIQDEIIYLIKQYIVYKINLYYEINIINIENEEHPKNIIIDVREFNLDDMDLFFNFLYNVFPKINFTSESLKNVEIYIYNILLNSKSIINLNKNVVISKINDPLLKKRVESKFEELDYEFNKKYKMQILNALKINFKIK